MEQFVHLTAIAVPLSRANVDTDAIIPSREMKQVAKTGLADGLFANWRYIDVDARLVNPAFVLNDPRYAGARILIGGLNFGCGSSREHAVWALHEYGIRCIIAPSFGAIFHDNCVRNGLLPAVLPEDNVKAIVDAAVNAPTPVMTVDLEARELTDPMGRTWRFFVSEADREMLLEGLDPIGVTLKRIDQIRDFEATYRTARPWLFAGARSSRTA